LFAAGSVVVSVSPVSAHEANIASIIIDTIKIAIARRMMEFFFISIHPFCIFFLFIISYFVYLVNNF
jgi:hypothetical protein